MSTSNDDFTVTWDGQTLLALKSASAQGYTLYTYTVTGTGSDVLEFAARQDPSQWDLDDVSLIPKGAETSLDGSVSVSDTPNIDDTLTTTLVVLHGKITVATTSGVIIGGNDSGSVMLTGTAAAINAALATANYLPTPGYGSDSLTVTTTDPSSISSNKTVTQTVPITVTSVIPTVRLVWQAAPLIWHWLNPRSEWLASLSHCHECAIRLETERGHQSRQWHVDWWRQTTQRADSLDRRRLCRSDGARRHRNLDQCRRQHGNRNGCGQRRGICARFANLRDGRVPTHSQAPARMICSFSRSRSVMTSIYNFNVTSDKIDLVGFDGVSSFVDIHLADDANGNAVVTLGSGETITLHGVDAGLLTAGNFEFDQAPVTDNAATMVISDGAILPLSGIIDNSGTIELNSTGDMTELQITGDGITLEGGGQIVMSDSDMNFIVGTSPTTRADQCR